MAARERVLLEILLSPTPDARRGTGDKAIQQLRKNVGAKRNECVRTILRLLDANGKHEEFAQAFLTLHNAGTPALSLTEALLHETTVECRENPLQARALAGDWSGPTLAALEAEFSEHIDSLEAAKQAVSAELIGRMAA